MTSRRPLIVLFAFVLMVAAACQGSATDIDASPAPSNDETTVVGAVEDEPADDGSGGDGSGEDGSSEDGAAEDGADDEPVEGESSEPAPEPEPVAFADDFANSILPIFAEHCASCHNAGGPGSPHWQLETVADIADNSLVLAAAVGEGYMPPWPAGPQSVSFRNDISLRADEIDAIVEWATSGGEVDVDPSTPVAAVDGIVGLGEIDDELEPHETYDGTPAVVDDYRCMIYDPQLTEGTWLTGYEFVPDKTEIVHHAIGYLLPAEAMDVALDRSADDDTGGWQCYGSSGLPHNDPLFIGWAPGQGPTQYPDGSGLWIEPGAFIVIQVHYHNEVDTDPDSSTLRVDYTDGSADLDEVGIAEYIAPAEIPCSSDETGPLCDRDAALARAIERFGPEGVQATFVNRLCGVTPEDFAGMTDGVASSSCQLPIYEFGEIISVLGHEHEIGATFRMTLNPGASDERILLDIPTWSFDWQYNYEPAEPISVKPGDTVLIECSWDRSLRDPDLEPSYILWADGTNDEMCFSTMTVR